MSRTRDFAKTLPKQRGRGHKSGAKPPYFLWIVTIILCGGFIIGLTYLSLNDNKSHHSAKSDAKPVAVKKSVADKPKQKPRFEFYNMLPAMTVVDPVSPQSDVKTSTTESGSENQQFAVQIAAVNHYQEADKLKARLILQGFDVRLQPIQTPKGRFYRVLIGPYPSRYIAAKERERLQHLHFNGFLVKV